VWTPAVKFTKRSNDLIDTSYGGFGDFVGKLEPIRDIEKNSSGGVESFGTAYNEYKNSKDTSGDKINRVNSRSQNGDDEIHNLLDSPEAAIEVEEEKECIVVEE
jgi:hypothetical protein